MFPHLCPVCHDLNHLEQFQIPTPVFDQCVGGTVFIAGEMYGNEEREMSSGSKKRKAKSGDVVAVTLPALVQQGLQTCNDNQPQRIHCSQHERTCGLGFEASSQRIDFKAVEGIQKRKRRKRLESET